MSKTIKPENLEKELQEYLTQYKEDIDEEVVEATNTVIKEAKQELIQTSPRSGIARNTKYYKGWAIKNGVKSRTIRNKYSRVIWNKTNYQLTHLLEFGHATRNGGRTQAQPHIRPVEEKYGQEFADLLKTKIRRTK